MSSITIRITITDIDGVAVGLDVATDKFNPHVTPENIGMVWVSLCTALNEHIRARGWQDFDCLKGHMLS